MQELLIRGFMPATEFATLWNFQLQLSPFLFCNFLHFYLATNRLAESATTRFEHSHDVLMGGLLAGLPALCSNGLLKGITSYMQSNK
jgi:hypothetical protein